MQLNFNGLEYVVGNAETVENMPAAPRLRPFEEDVLAFLNALSGMLRQNRAYPDVATFGFWCRKAALLQEKAKYDDISSRFGSGIVFHSTPSNVPVNFAFSFASGLLAGNANIVRLPGKPFPQVDIICGAVKSLLEGEHKALAPYICFVKYASTREINDAFSALCDVRVVWGGDGTINRMRQSPLKPRATEITFADRHSIAVINADAYLAAGNKDKITTDFYNDTYYTDQNACTSPRIIFWMGREKEKAKAEFWGRVHAAAEEKYNLAPVQAVGKLHAMYKAAAARSLHREQGEDMLVTRLKVDALDAALMDHKYNSGFFFEYDIDALDEILPVCDQRCQTLTYLGLTREEIGDFLARCRPQGIDRAVPMGKSMDFTLVWDGFDLIRSMTRRVGLL